MSACSACAGDYEDPERTAAPAEEENTDEDERNGHDDPEKNEARDER